MRILSHRGGKQPTPADSWVQRLRGADEDGWRLRWPRECVQEEGSTPPKKQKGKRGSSRPVAPERPLLLDASQYYHFWPNHMSPYIRGYYDIKGDGNCGFRSLTLAQGYSQDNYSMTRRAMMATLIRDWDLIEKTLAAGMTQQRMLDKLSPDGTYPTAPKYKWFCTPDMGLIAATSLNICLVVLGDWCSTYLPLRAAPDHGDNSELPVVCLGFLPTYEHWILVRHLIL